MNPRKLLWLDIESTGLDPSKHRLLEVAACATEFDRPFELQPMHHYIQGVLPVTERELTTLDPFILDMHTKNGLLQECRNLKDEAGRGDALRPATPFPARYFHGLQKLEERLLALIPLKKDVDRENISALAGSSVHFDLAFLRVHMPMLATNLSHRVYDVSAVKLFCRSLGMPKLPPEEAHRAWPDIQESMLHARMCEEWLRGYGAQHKEATELHEVGMSSILAYKEGKP